MYKNQIKKVITYGSYGLGKTSHTSFFFPEGTFGKFKIFSKLELKKMSFDDKLAYSLDLLEYEEFLMVVLEKRKKASEVLEIQKKLIEQLKKEYKKQ